MSNDLPVSSGPNRATVRRYKTMAFVLVLGLLAGLGYANYQLVRVALASETGCVAHSPPGIRGSAPSAAKSSCRPPIPLR